jgi:hypothetical protein
MGRHGGEILAQCGLRLGLARREVVEINGHGTFLDFVA